MRHREGLYQIDLLNGSQNRVTERDSQMKQYIFTVDTGTTNTRVILWDERRRILGVEKRRVGVRNTAIDGNNDRLKAAVKSCLDTLMEAHGLEYGQVKGIIACGMITSNVGLVEIPHLVAPVSIDDLY